MGQSVGLLDTECPSFISEVGLGEVGDRFAKISRHSQMIFLK